MKRNLIIILSIVMLFCNACGTRRIEQRTIKVAVLPVLDVLPLYVAQQEGYFEKEGLQVELIPVSSAPERDQLMQSGQVDAILNEIVSTLFYNQDGTRVVMVRYARAASSQYPVFRILASADSGITDVNGLRGIPIGISDGTVIEYTTDRVLQKAGLSDDEIAKIAVPKIPDRMALLGTGELAAANLPDPVASLAVMQGARVIIDDSSYPEISCSVISFSLEMVENNPGSVEAFLRAYEEAVDAINSDKTRWSDLLIDQQLVPEPLLASYELPDYPTAGVPTEFQFNDALAWAQSKGLIGKDLKYEDSVNPDLLP